MGWRVLLCIIPAAWCVGWVSGGQICREGACGRGLFLFGGNAGPYSLLADSRKEARIPFCPQHLKEGVFDSWSLGGTSALHHDSLHFLPSLSQCLLTG